MPERFQKLQTAVHQLESELQSAEPLDEETTEMLAEAAREIQAALNKQNFDALEDSSIVQSLRHATEQFESSHPTLTGILSRMIDVLGQIGI